MAIFDLKSFAASLELVGREFADRLEEKEASVVCLVDEALFDQSFKRVELAIANGFCTAASGSKLPLNTARRAKRVFSCSSRSSSLTRS